MENSSSHQNANDAYLRIWDVEQRHKMTRWTISTFFFSVSFAIFEFSLQASKFAIPLIISQLAAIGIYWFAYLVFRRFHDFTRFLIGYLLDMEIAKKTSLEMQTKSRAFIKGRGNPSSTTLLGVFGIVYSVAALAIGIFL